MCGVNTCPIHERVNARDEVTDQFSSGRAVTYDGEYCIVTMDNPDYNNPMMALAALLGGQEFKVPGMFVTLVVKVGDRAVGDLSDDEVRINEAHREEFVEHDDSGLDPFRGSLNATEEEVKILSESMAKYLNGVFMAKHDEAVAAVQAGLIA